MNTVGERVKQVRLRKVLTQEDLAKLSGVSEVQLSRIENGHVEVRQSTVRKLAGALGVDPSWLMWGDEPTMVGTN